jgi:hypothetical protein
MIRQTNKKLYQPTYQNDPYNVPSAKYWSPPPIRRRVTRSRARGMGQVLFRGMIRRTIRESAILGILLLIADSYVNSGFRFEYALLGFGVALAYNFLSGIVRVSRKLNRRNGKR